MVDVTKEDQVKSWTEGIISRFGRLDLAANIAGAAHQSTPLDEITRESFDFVVELNLRGVLNCMSEQLKHLHPGSSIVNVSSGSGLRAEPGLSVYSAAKSGVNTLTTAAAGEYGTKQIRVNAVAPGITPTPRILNSGHTAFIKPVADGTPLGRAGQPEEIARAIAFLLSEESSFISGVVLRVDGGYLNIPY